MFSYLHRRNTIGHFFSSWWVAFLSAFIGTFSHVVLDSIMHSDVEPFYPFNASNNLLGIISVADLHKFCVYSAFIGGILYFGIYGLQKFNKRRQSD
ncbi:MAG: DUF4184 family protein [Cellvibrionaceae bacterium]